MVCACKEVDVNASELQKEQITSIVARAKSSDVQFERVLDSETWQN